MYGTNADEKSTPPLERVIFETSLLVPSSHRARFILAATGGDRELHEKVSRLYEAFIRRQAVGTRTLRAEVERVA